MSLIDEELESFSDEDIEVMIEVIDDGIQSHINILKKVGELSIQDLIDQDEEFAEIYKRITNMIPYNTEDITQRVIKKHTGLVRTKLLNMQNIITKLHLLKSRL